MTHVNLKIRVELDSNFFPDVIDAFLQGPAYWTESSLENPDGTLTVMPAPELYKQVAHRPIVLTHERLAEAVEKIVSTEVQVNNLIANDIAFSVREYKDASEIDADCADVIVQVACFGEVLFS